MGWYKCAATGNAAISCGNAAMRQCGNAAMILKQKFINKNFHKKQISVTNNPKILQPYNPTLV